MAEHGDHDFQYKYVALVATLIGGAVLVIALIGLFTSTF